MTKEYTLNIFDVLSKISCKNIKYYNILSEKELKAFYPFVIQRWLSGIKSERQIMFLNTLLNPYVFTLPNTQDKTGHNELLYYIMTICAPGQVNRYKWLKMSGKTITIPNIVNVVCKYFNYSKLHALDIIPLLDNDTIIEYAIELGTQPDDIKKIKKELKNR